MKYPQILATLTGEPLIITPVSHASLFSLFTNDGLTERAVREGVDMCGAKADLPQAEMMDGIWQIPVTGPIGRGLGAFEKGAGCVDVADIQDELMVSEEDPNSRGSILVFDTPGGMYAGTPELADVIAACEKPTFAFVPGQCCSAGYWLACSCDAIFSTQSADIGSVGVYCYALDRSKQFEQQGVKPVLITSGKYKGMGVPGLPLTKEQIQHLQDRVDAMAKEFYSHVQETRGDISMADMQGQSWVAPQALARGFIDSIVTGIDDVVAMF